MADKDKGKDKTPPKKPIVWKPTGELEVRGHKTSKEKDSNSGKKK